MAGKTIAKIIGGNRRTETGERSKKTRDERQETGDRWSSKSFICRHSSFVSCLSGFIILLISILQFNCANQIPPSGGDVDLTPPEIENVYPANGTTNFRDNYIEIHFSEYVDKRSLQDALFISPAFESLPEFDWSGTSVRIEFPEKLKDNITYAVSIGTDLVDLNNHNRMAKSYSFSFSTGSKIDRGVVEGKVYDETPSGTMIYAFPLDSGEVNPSKVKPKYISQAGKTGEYMLSGLAPGNYRIFAVKDEFKDFIYNVGDDSYGSPYRDISLSEHDSLFRGLNYFITKEDTSKPRMLSASMTDRFHILAAFSEAIDSTLYSSKNFFIVDSSTGRTLQPLYAFQGRSKRTEIVLSIKDTLSDQNNIFLISKILRDRAGNLTENDYSRITVTAKPDTSAPLLVKMKPSERSSSIETSRPEFSFYFDDGFDSILAKAGISASDRAGNKIPYSLRFYDDASFMVKFQTELKTKQDYAININLRNLVDAAGNRRDSVYKYLFTTFTGLDFTGVSGIVKTAKDMKANNIYVVLQNVEKEKLHYKKKAGQKLNFDFNKVEPGKYRLWSFESRDSSGVYNYGKPFPFKPSDRFTFYPDTLNLRARWPVSDVNVGF